jgi:hypothetical protein
VPLQVPGALEVRHKHPKGHPLRPARQTAELDPIPLPRVAAIQEAAERQGKHVEASLVPQSRERRPELELHVSLVRAADQMLDERANRHSSRRGAQISFAVERPIRVVGLGRGAEKALIMSVSVVATLVVIFYGDNMGLVEPACLIQPMHRREKDATIGWTSMTRPEESQGY